MRKQEVERPTLKGLIGTVPGEIPLETVAGGVICYNPENRNFTARYPSKIPTPNPSFSINEMRKTMRSYERARAESAKIAGVPVVFISPSLTKNGAFDFNTPDIWHDGVILEQSAIGTWNDTRFVIESEGRKFTIKDRNVYFRNGTTDAKRLNRIAQTVSTLEAEERLLLKGNAVRGGKLRAVGEGRGEAPISVQQEGQEGRLIS